MHLSNKDGLRLPMKSPYNLSPLISVSGLFLCRYIPDRVRQPQPDEGAPRTSCPQGLSRKARLVAILKYPLAANNEMEDFDARLVTQIYPSNQFRSPHKQSIHRNHFVHESFYH